jgi:hypothetical protein
MQFLQPRLAGIKNPESSLTPVLHDRLYADALKQARRLLEMAAAADDPDVHAYQLFEPNKDPLSFGAIQKILESAGWDGPCAENTLKGYGFTIIEAAQEAIDKRIEEINSIHTGYFGTDVELESITDRIRRFLSKMIRTTGLNRLLVDSEEIVERCIGCLIEEAQNKVNCGGASNFELFNESWACLRFVKYVCDGLSFGQFMKGDTRSQSKNREASLESAIHFIDHEIVMTGAAGLKDADVHKLKQLGTWITAKKSISRNAKEHLKKSLRFLEALPPEPANARIEAGHASTLLKLDLAHWKLQRLQELLPSKKLKALLARLQKPGSDDAFDPTQLDILKSFAKPPLLDPGIPPVQRQLEIPLATIRTAHRRQLKLSTDDNYKQGSLGGSPRSPGGREGRSPRRGFRGEQTGSSCLSSAGFGAAAP